MAVEETSAGVQLISGALAGLVSESVVHPMDTVRTRLQTQGRSPAAAGSAASAAAAAVGLKESGAAATMGGHRYSGTGHALRTVLRQEGIRGLYGGFGPVCAFTVPAHGLYFIGYELAKARLQPGTPLEEKSPWVHFTAGIIAEVAGAVLWTPQDVIKQRLQMLPPHLRPSAWSAVAAVVRQDGVTGMWRGFGAGVATYAPFMGIYFTTYEYCKVLAKRASGIQSDADLGLGVYLVSGAIGGGVGAAATCPLDVMKTRIQVQSKNADGAYQGIGQVFRSIVKEEGYGAFWSGLSARVLWIAPACAITIAAYEKFKKLLEGK